jgi:hypothetical protein
MSAPLSFMPAASRGGRAGKGEVAVEKGSRDCRSKALRLIEAGEVRFQDGSEGMGASAKAVLGGLRA